MTTSSLVIERTGYAVIQDLGRPGCAEIGIPANGAADHHAARTANILVGNADTAPLIEATGSELAVVAGSDLLISVTGAAEHVLVDGHRQPAWETLAVFRGSRITVPTGATGFRSYLAVNGHIKSELELGSVAPDHILGVGRRLTRGDHVDISTAYAADPSDWYAPLFRLGASRPHLSSVATIEATLGPDVERIKGGLDVLSSPYEVSKQSDHIGLRLFGPAIEQTTNVEILSRGVPVGAIEVPPTGGIIMLLRGRLVTAGYPVVGIVTSESLDRLGQVRPGDFVHVTSCDLETARARLLAKDRQRGELATRVGAAFSSSGLGDIVDPVHRSNRCGGRRGDHVAAAVTACGVPARLR